MGKTHRFKIERETTKAGLAWRANKSTKRPSKPKWYVSDNFQKARKAEYKRKKGFTIEDANY